MILFVRQNWISYWLNNPGRNHLMVAAWIGCPVKEDYPSLYAGLA